MLSVSPELTDLSESTDDCGGVADIVAVVDSSGSMGVGNWNRMRDFFIELLKMITISRDGNHIGFVKFSDDAINEFFLNTYYTVEEIEKAPLNYVSGYTNTAAGLERMLREQFTSENGDRPGIPNIAILMTDGPSNRRQSETIPLAQEAHARGIFVFVIAITHRISEAEVKAISSPPHEEYKNWITIGDFSDLQATLGNMSDLLSVTCVTTPSPTIISTTREYYFLLSTGSVVGKLRLLFSLMKLLLHLGAPSWG